MRINKYIATRLGISRRRADEIISRGRITVDGLGPNPGQDVSDANTVLIDNRPLPQTKNFEYILLNKPAGYVCSRDGQGSNSIYDLLPHKYDHLNPVGRLDKDSSGLLLLTNDGELHNKLTHPSFQKEKQYQVVLNKPLAQDDISAISLRGVTLSDGSSKFGITQTKKNSADYIVTLHEGRNRQIRRTFNALGYKIESLARISFGDYKLDDLALGDIKPVNAPTTL